MGTKQGIRVCVLDESGHTEAMMAPAQAVETVRQQMGAGKWAFADGRLIEGEPSEESLRDAEEVICTFPLVGGQ